MKILILLLVLFCTSICTTTMADEFTRNSDLFDYLGAEDRDEYHSDSGGSAYNKSLGVLYQVLNLADWAQTRQIARQPNQYYETTFPTGSASFIGEHPSQGSVNVLHLIKAIGQPLLVSQLHEPWKSIFSTLSVGAAANAVNGNRQIGLDMVRW